MNITDFFSIDSSFISYLVVDITIAIILVIALRFLSGLVAHVRSADELAKRDNYAFGVGLGSGIFALALVLTGILSGPFSNTLGTEALLMLGYGVLGIVLIKLGRLIQDKLVLPRIHIKDEISRENLAAALVDSGNVIATAIVIRAAMLWVDTISWPGMVAVIGGFIIAQIILGLVARYRFIIFAARHSGKHLESAFEEGNTALALRYAGHVVGVSLAVSTSAYFVNYLADSLSSMVLSLALWGGFAIIMTIFLSVFAIIARTVILFNINVVEEVDQQRNIGVGCIEGVIYISIGLLLVGLMA